MSTGKKILVADDSLTIRKLVETVLTQDGYEVVTAENGADCLALAAAQKPSLILLDYILPDKQGTEICRELINSPDTWEIPVLMMSSNGNAIRQLYQDLNNVADYLTKPFAPNVLKAVVGHLLDKPGMPAADAAANDASPAPAAAAPRVPAELMDKVTRLLDLMENTSASGDSAKAAAAAGQGDTAPAADQPAPRKAKAKAKASRRKSGSTAQTSDAVQRKFRLAIQKHLRARLAQIPDWEISRGLAAPEEYFLSRILSKDLLADLSAALVRATGMPSEGPGALRCPASLLPLDASLRHLQSLKVTGELRVETAEETILLCLDQGEVVLVTTNHPRSYCAGAACDFGSVPHTAISEAVRAQEEQSLPFFLSLREAGHLPADADLNTLLRSQGERCLNRAIAAPEATLLFFPLSRLPAMARSSTNPWPLDQLLLTCYRSVDDWFTLEKAFPDLDATLIPEAELTARLAGLSPTPQEQQILQALAPSRTLAELVEATGLKQFEICRALFGFIKLGLVRHGPRRTDDSRVDEEIPAVASEAAPLPPPLPAEESAPACDSAAPESLPEPPPVTPLSEPALKML